MLYHRSEKIAIFLNSSGSLTYLWKRLQASGEGNHTGFHQQLHFINMHLQKNKWFCQNTTKLNKKHQTPASVTKGREGQLYPGWKVIFLQLSRQPPGIKCSCCFQTWPNSSACSCVCLCVWSSCVCRPVFVANGKRILAWNNTWPFKGRWTDLTESRWSKPEQTRQRQGDWMPPLWGEEGDQLSGH